MSKGFKDTLEFKELTTFFSKKQTKPRFFDYDENGDLIEIASDGSIVKTIAIPSYRKVTLDEINEMESKRMEDLKVASNEFDEIRNRLYEESRKSEDEKDDTLIFKLNRDAQEADIRLQSIRFQERTIESEKSIELRKIDFRQPNETRKFPHLIRLLQTNPFMLQDQYVRIGALEKPITSVAEAKEEKQEPVILFTDLETDPYAMLGLNWKAPIMYNGKQYHSAKQAIAAELAIQFDDKAHLEQIMAAESAKDITYTVNDVPGDKDLNEVRWNTILIPLIKAVNEVKFSLYPELANKLIETGYSPLGAYIPDDTLLGIGLPVNSIDAQNTLKWTQNLLGKALMEIRTELQSRPPPAPAPAPAPVPVKKRTKPTVASKAASKAASLQTTAPSITNTISSTVASATEAVKESVIEPLSEMASAVSSAVSSALSPAPKAPMASASVAPMASDDTQVVINV